MRYSKCSEVLLFVQPFYVYETVIILDQLHRRAVSNYYLTLICIL